MIEGLLLVDKPKGISSFGVVAKVRWLITQDVKRVHLERGYCKNPEQKTTICRCKMKVGHTGTLDPAATGLLVLAIGAYTKKVPELIKQDKIYEVEMTLGKKSTTGDKEGEISDVSALQPAESAISKALGAFTGSLQQTPPAFSAIKVNGQRAYDLARKGKPVVIEPRTVTIYDNTLTSYRYPLVTFTSHVGSGTYIRSLVEDIGTQLKTSAYMSNLRRITIGDYPVNEALSLNDIDIEQIKTSLLLTK